jgi:hypothetical protein
VTIATWVLAVAAICALLANVYQARQTKKAVDTALAETKAVESQTAALLRQAVATEQQASASQEQARVSQRLAKHAQTSLELEWQPLLVYARIGETDDPRPLLENNGRGPAYRSVAIVRDRAILRASKPVSLGAGEQHRVPELYNLGNPGGFIPDGAAWGAFCEDQFGSRYRFLEGGTRPEVWHPGEEESTVVWLKAWRLTYGGAVLDTLLLG